MSFYLLHRADPRRCAFKSHKPPAVCVRFCATSFRSERHFSQAVCRVTFRHDVGARSDDFSHTAPQRRRPDFAEQNLLHKAKDFVNMRVALLSRFLPRPSFFGRFRPFALRVLRGIRLYAKNPSSKQTFRGNFLPNKGS